MLCVMIVFPQEVLSSKVASKGNSRDTEAGEGALESIESSKRPRVPPLLTGRGMRISEEHTQERIKGVLSCPWIAFGAIGRGRGEFPGIEAGDGGAWCHVDGTARMSCDHRGYSQWTRMHP